MKSLTASHAGSPNAGSQNTVNIFVRRTTEVNQTLLILTPMIR
ncbi:Glutaredoxin family protein [Lacticaseibacillus paracasei]|nr:Glutaredoxin family protein [Lacticaseibacillus paracasei]